MSEAFELHPRLAADCVPVGRLSLSELLLFDDARYPWFVLVPRRPGVSEIFELPTAQQAQLWQESAQLASFMKQTFAADKLNIGVLGNLVPQLHMHHIARYRTDPAWPGPVWGHSRTQRYGRELLEERLALTRAAFGAQLRPAD